MLRDKKMVITGLLYVSIEAYLIIYLII
jgi:hypothetical protein